MQIDARNLGILLRRDVRAQWVVVLILLALEFVTVVSLVAQFPPPMQESAGVFLQGATSIGTFVMAYRAVATEESVGVMGFLKSLPLTNDEIFGSRFIFMTGYVVVNAFLLNGAYIVARPLLGWSDTNPSWGVIVGGMIVQLLFAVILVSVALLVNSEKAIWVPFALVIVLLNGYTLLASKPESGGSRMMNHVRDNWLVYGLATIAFLAAVATLVLRMVKTKKTLVK